MDTHRRLQHVGAAALAIVMASCGAKTGLLIPDASQEPDAGMDAGVDAGTDSGVDGGMCEPRPLELERRSAQVVFVIDRSNSMADTLDGRMPEPGELRRWDVLAQVLEGVLSDADPTLELGAKFFPRAFETEPETPDEACSAAGGVDLPPARGNVDRLLRFFVDTQPLGGTPTAAGLAALRDFLDTRPAPGVPRFVILATDGGPNCNPDTGVPHTVCLCTGQPESCASPDYGPYNCIDEERTLGVIDELFGERGIPVYVVGIDDPTRPDLADVLDRMAIAGGRPRDPDEGGRRFYSVRRADDLRGALTTITDSISECVFRLTPRPGPADLLDVRVGGVLVPRDGTRTEGWDFTLADRSELTLFGGACERVTSTGAEVIAEIACPPEE